MTDHGLRIFNKATGSVQIDRHYRNRELLEIATFITQPNPDWSHLPVGEPNYASGFSWFRLPAGMSREVYFIGPWHLCRRGYSAVDTGGYNNIYVVDAPVGTVITGYVFGHPQQHVESGKSGLRVRRKADQAVMFDSRRPYLDIAAIVTGSNYTATMPGRTLPSGRTYAVRPLQWSGKLEMWQDRVWLPGSFTYVYGIREDGLMMRMSGNVLQSKEARYIAGEQLGFLSNYGGGYGAAYTKHDYAIAIADVTHFTL